VGLPSIILQLEQIAAVTAVLGNTDDPSHRYRLTETIDLAGRKFLVHHIVNRRALDEALEKRIKREKRTWSCSGIPTNRFASRSGRCCSSIPDYAGKSRFGMERSAAILHCDEQTIRPNISSSSERPCLIPPSLAAGWLHTPSR
jgi:hypothetical protein